MNRTYVEQRSFVIGGHHICLEKEYDTNETQVYGVADMSPECVVKTQVNITAECDDCYCKFEMISEDDNEEIQRIERYLFGAFISRPCPQP
jgi:hypothetical protein